MFFQHPLDVRFAEHGDAHISVFSTTRAAPTNALGITTDDVRVAMLLQRKYESLPASNVILPKSRQRRFRFSVKFPQLEKVKTNSDREPAFGIPASGPIPAGPPAESKSLTQKDVQNYVAELAPRAWRVPNRPDQRQAIKKLFYFQDSSDAWGFALAIGEIARAHKVR